MKLDSGLYNKSSIPYSQCFNVHVYYLIGKVVTSHILVNNIPFVLCPNESFINDNFSSLVRLTAAPGQNHCLLLFSFSSYLAYFGDFSRVATKWLTALLKN